MPFLTDEDRYIGLLTTIINFTSREYILDYIRKHLLNENGISKNLGLRLHVNDSKQAVVQKNMHMIYTIY